MPVGFGLPRHHFESEKKERKKISGKKVQALQVP